MVLFKEKKRENDVHICKETKILSKSRLLLLNLDSREKGRNFLKKTKIN